MQRFLWILTLPVLVAACAGAGPGAGAPTEPIDWPTGRFLLEGSVSYASGFGTIRDTYVARLVIAPAGSMALESDTGVCRDRSPTEVRRDRQIRARTFRCGDVTFELRPASGTVVGALEAVVMEDYEVRQCIQYSVLADGERVCLRSRSSIETRPVRKEAVLRVSREP